MGATAGFGSVWSQVEAGGETQNRTHPGPVQDPELQADLGRAPGGRGGRKDGVGRGLEPRKPADPTPPKA